LIVTNPSGSTGGIIVHVFGRTDVGRTREHNEDAFVVADLSADNATLQPEVRTHVAGPKGSLFMVADGMGGAAAGEIASAMATDTVLQELRETWLVSSDGDSESFARAIKQAAKTANERINQFAGSHPEYRGMGTTATIAGLLGDTLYLAQVGDSRAYLVRDGVAIQITKDQSLMQKLVEAGELTEEEAEHSDRRNIILQALGPETSIKVDLTHQAIRRGDTLVLCSDGLSTQIGKDEIARIVVGEPDLTAACRALIDRANENGGPDNITVILARFDGDGLSAVQSDDHVGHRVFPITDSSRPTPPAPMDRVPETPTVPVPIVPRPEAARSEAPRAEQTRPTRPIVERNDRVVAAAPPPSGPTARQAILYTLIALLGLIAAWWTVSHFRTTSATSAASAIEVPTPLAQSAAV
jgi:protein phosphatase